MSDYIYNNMTKVAHIVSDKILARNILKEYGDKGFDVNKTEMTAQYCAYFVYVIIKDSKYEYNVNGLLLDDIIGCYGREDLLRLNSYRNKFTKG